MKKWIFALLFSFFIFGSFCFADAQGEVEIYFFYSKTCPHCAAEKDFLENLVEEYEGVKLREFVVSKNFELLENYYQDYQVPEEIYGLVPITFIGERYFLGFSEEIGEEIEGCIKNMIESEEPCDSSGGPAGSLEEVSPPFETEKEVQLPFIGKINSKDYSLPVLAVILGFFDGFNVCSLGALVLILSLVLALRERKKIFVFGGIFILTSAVIYGFLIVLWYQLFSFFALYLRVMEVLIGLLGIVGGIYFLRQFIRYKKYGPACQTTGASTGIVAKMSGKIKESLGEQKSIFLAALGVLVFAAVVTIVEFPCSAAIPVLFAGILAEAQLSTFLYLLYIGIFVLFYMFDEFVIFLIAVLTMNIKLVAPKVLTWITLVASLILFFLGFYYLFGF